MRLPSKGPTAAFAAVLGVLVLGGDSPATAQNQDPVPANPATSSSAGLILQESEGELRVRRRRVPQMRLVDAAGRDVWGLSPGQTTRAWLGTGDWRAGQSDGRWSPG